MVQIFVKLDWLKTSPLMVSASDKVDDVLKRILNNEKSSNSDVYMTCEGRVLRWSDDLSSSGVSDGCTLYVLNRMCGGGKHKNKKNQTEKKLARSPKRQEPVRDQQEHDEENIIQSLLSRENVEEAVIRDFEETEGSRKIIADLAEGNKSDMERWIQTSPELTGLDDEQNKTTANGIRRAVEARRKDTGREPTAAPKQGKKVCFIMEEKEVQEARQWQEQFIEKRRRAQEAHEEEWREQEKKRYGEDDDERVPVVPDMEAGSSYFKTTYPRDEGEKIVMEELEERKTGRGSDGLVRGVRVQVSDEGDQWKGVRKGRRRKRKTWKQRSTHRARGRFRTRRKKPEGRTSVERQTSNGTCDNWIRGGKHKKKKNVLHELRKDQRIVKWIGCSDDEQEGLEETAKEKEKCEKKRGPESRAKRKGGERRSRRVWKKWRKCRMRESKREKLRPRRNTRKKREGRQERAKNQNRKAR